MQLTKFIGASLVQLSQLSLLVFIAFSDSQERLISCILIVLIRLLRRSNDVISSLSLIFLCHCLLSIRLVLLLVLEAIDANQNAWMLGKEIEPIDEARRFRDGHVQAVL